MENKEFMFSYNEIVKINSFGDLGLPPEKSNVRTLGSYGWIRRRFRDELHGGTPLAVNAYRVEVTAGPYKGKTFVLEEKHLKAIPGFDKLAENCIDILWYDESTGLLSHSNYIPAAKVGDRVGVIPSDEGMINPYKHIEEYAVAHAFYNQSEKVFYYLLEGEDGKTRIIADDPSKGSVVALFKYIDNVLTEKREADPLKAGQVVIHKNPCSGSKGEPVTLSNVNLLSGTVTFWSHYMQEDVTDSLNTIFPLKGNAPKFRVGNEVSCLSSGEYRKVTGVYEACGGGYDISAVDENGSIEVFSECKLVHVPKKVKVTKKPKTE